MSDWGCGPYKSKSANVVGLILMYFLLLAGPVGAVIAMVCR